MPTEQQPAIDLSTILLISMIGLFVLAFGSVFIFVMYQRRMMEKDDLIKQRESQYQKGLLQAIIKSQEAERKRIAHDLHDEIGALLTTSRIYFNRLDPQPAEEQMAAISEKVNGLFDEMMSNIRRISQDLRPVILEKLGLVEALESLGDKLLKGGIQFEFSHYLPNAISKEAELLLYRIIQELVTNTLKHAEAESIQLTLEVRYHALYLIYRDDGLGMNNSGGSEVGLGMKSIESRLSVLDGVLQQRKQQQGVYFYVEIASDKLRTYA